jgi:large conductance mechanosensitive channel
VYINATSPFITQDTYRIQDTSNIKTMTEDVSAAASERGLDFDATFEQFPLLPEKVEKEATTMWTEYKLFIDRGNVIQLAVGLVIGTAFASIVTSFVSDVLSPVLGMVTSSRLSESFAVVHKGPNYPYLTRESARTDGAVTLNYGAFIQTYLNFLAISASLFLVMKILSASRAQKIDSERIKECPFCLSDIPGKAMKCPKCTADIK